MQIARLTTPLLITLLLTISVTAQESTAPSDPPDLVIMGKNWRKQVVDPNWGHNESRHNEELARLGRAQGAYLEDVRAQPNQPTVSKMPTSTAPKPVTPASQILTTYTYTLKVKNTGERTIKLIGWEYQFVDPDTQQVKEQRKITSRVKLSPGKTQVIKRHLTRQPTIAVNANQLGRKHRDQFTERAIITQIVYTDGSVWRRTKD